jgi:hypothetical protein
MDEFDMRRALDLKLEKRLTRKKTYDNDLLTIQQFLDRDPPIIYEKEQSKTLHSTADNAPV